MNKILRLTVLTAFVLTACGYDSRETTVIEQQKDFAGVIAESSSATFSRDVLETRGPVLVDFYADWCGPCKRMEPIIDQVAREYSGKVKVVRVDVDKNPDLSKRYNIQAIPHMILFKDGDIVHSVVGVTTADKLSQTLERTL